MNEIRIYVNEDGSLAFNNLTKPQKAELVRHLHSLLYAAGDFENTNACWMALKQLAAQ